MRIYTGSGLDSFLALIASLSGGSTEIIDTGARGEECTESKQWHLDQIDQVTKSLREGTISAAQGAEAIQILTDCMEATEEMEQSQRTTPTIHSSLSDENREGARRLVASLLSGKETPRQKRLREADEIHDELVSSLRTLSSAMKGDRSAPVSRATQEKAVRVINRLNDMLTAIRQESDNPAPPDVVDGIAILNDSIKELNSSGRIEVEIPLVLQPNEIARTAPEASGSAQGSSEGSTRPKGRKSVSSDSRGLVQRRKRARKGKAQPDAVATKAKRPNPRRSAAQKARWARVKAAAAAKTKTSRKK